MSEQIWSAIRTQIEEIIIACITQIDWDICQANNISSNVGGEYLAKNEKG